jgi:hypothetical protein
MQVRMLYKVIAELCLVEPVRPLTRTSALPESIGQLSNLKELRCGGNSIVGRCT